MENNDAKFVVTSLEELAEYQKGTLVELPPFGPDQPFYARLRRPSMLALAKAGKIPNSLLETANNMFMGNLATKSTSNKDTLSNVFEVIDVLCEAAFVEPSYTELKKLNIELTDDQYAFVFSFTQKGVDALRSFRGQQGYIQDSENSESK